MKVYRRYWAPTAALIAGILALTACDEAPDEPVSGPPPWLDRIDLEVLGSRKAFDNNTEVFLRLKSKANLPMTIEGLSKDGAVVLVHGGGAVASIHPLSVGVAKPIALASGETKRTSLLFRAAPGPPSRFKAWNLERPVPEGAGEEGR